MRFDPDTIPSRMRGRPLDHRGFPVPWFVTEKLDDGRWDFARITEERMINAIKNKLCWVTGEKMGKHMAFVIGPMCVVNRVASDPPAIPEIAKWSAQVCPFLSRPRAKRPDDGRPGTMVGHAVLDNPGMCAVWVTRDYKLNRHGLMEIGAPTEITWWREGSLATDEEIHAVFEERCAKLQLIAEEEGQVATTMFHRQKNWAKQHYLKQGAV